MMTTYQYGVNGEIISSDGRVIPATTKNGDYVLLLRLVNDGVITIYPYVPPIPQTIAELIDLAFPQTEAAKALFEALFEIANRLQALESKPAITKSQLRDWLIAKANGQ